jgi:hypothetical protein
VNSNQDYQDEAERLARLPPAAQAAVIALYRHLAASPEATPACRIQSKAKANACDENVDAPLVVKTGWMASRSGD